MPSSISSIGHSASASVSNDLEGHPNLLLSQASQGHKDAFEELRSGVDQLAPREAMGLWQRLAHPSDGDPVATRDEQSSWTSDQQNELVSALQTRSRQEPAQHLDGHLGELAKIPGDKQASSDEFSELKHTINGLSTPDARDYLNGFNSDAHPQLEPDTFRQLKEALQDRAGVRVTRSTGEPQELKDFGDIGPKHKFLKTDPTSGDNKLDHHNLADNDAYTAMGSGLSVPYGDGRKVFESLGYRNLPSLQAYSKKGARTTEGKTKVFETGIRAFVGTGSSIDPAKMNQAGQSFNVGVQGEANLVHMTYTVKHEPKGVALGDKEVLKAKFEGSVDAFVGANGDVRASFSAGEYPAIQIQGSAFVGARGEDQGKIKLSVLGRDAGEIKAKISFAAGAEVEGSLSFGRVNDSIEGNSITSPFELGGMAFAGVRSGVEVGGDLAGVGGKLKAEGWAGVGVMAKLYAKSENGTISFGGEHGAALGLGGSVSWGVSVNPGKVAKTISKELPAQIEAAVVAAPGVAGRKLVSGATATRDTLVSAGAAGVRVAAKAAANTAAVVVAGKQNASAALRSGKNAVSTQARAVNTSVREGVRSGARVAGRVAANTAAVVDAGKQNASAALRSGRNAVSTQARAVNTSVREGVRSGGRAAGKVAANTIAGVDGGVRKANAALRSGAAAVSTRAQSLIDNGRQFNADLRARIAQGSRKTAAPASSPSPAAEPPDEHEMSIINDTEIG